MIDYKSFALPGNATLRIRSEKIVATQSSKDGNVIDIYCADVAVPFHVKTTKHTSQEIIDYIWNIPNFEEEDDF